MRSPATQFIARRYELLDIAGEGGMATVWRARMHGAAGFTRQVALKQIKPALQAIENYINMFVEEARVGSDLEHPHIVQVHDFVADERSYYLVMEWVEGLDLGSLVRAFLRKGMRTPWQLLCAIAVDVLSGLAAAHERHQADGRAAPVIHRDVSPQNILVSINGIAKLTDFGLARARDRLFSLTAPGTVKGKLTYLPPEATYAHTVAPTADLFSMGNVLWEALAGRRLFRGETELDTFTLIRACQVPPLDELRPDIPAELANIIHTALAREPEARFSSARLMTRALAEVLQDGGWRDDIRLELGSAVIQARSPEGLTAAWRERARQEEPRWRGHVDARVAPARQAPAAQAPAAQALLGAAGRLDVAFTNAHSPGESCSVDVEFTDPRMTAPRKADMDTPPGAPSGPDTEEPGS